MSYRCPQCSKPTLPPAVNPSRYRLCAKCGHRFDPDQSTPNQSEAPRMSIEETYTEAAERHERLYWAWKAKKALRNTGQRDAHRAEDDPPTLTEGERSTWVARTGYNHGAYHRVFFTYSTLPRQKIMGDWERGVLERQLAVAPLVEAGDVKRAREQMTAAKKGMKAALKAREREAVKRAKRHRAMFAPVEYVPVGEVAAAC